MKTPPITLSKLIEGYFLSTKSRRMSEHTLEDYAHTYRLLCEYLGDTMIFFRDYQGTYW
jgi:hypothetical protein